MADFTVHVPTPEVQSTIVERVAGLVDRKLGSIIRANRLQPCVYILIRCVAHGDVRLIARHSPKGKRTHCPACGKSCRYTFLGKGGTMTALPFWTLPEAL